jgi:uncharacterized protein YwqG
MPITSTHHSAEDAYLASEGRPELINHTHMKPAEAEQGAKNYEAQNYSVGAEYWFKIARSLEWFQNDADHHKAEKSQWHLLLEVDSHSQCNMNWWDAGRLQFLVDRRDLSVLDFSRTYACIESH